MKNNKIAAHDNGYMYCKVCVCSLLKKTQKKQAHIYVNLKKNSFNLDRDESLSIISVIVQKQIYLVHITETSWIFSNSVMCSGVCMCVCVYAAIHLANGAAQID